MNRRSLFLTCMLLIWSSTTSTKVIIWDIGDVLYKPSTFGVMKAIGISHLIGHILIDWKNPWSLEKTFFNVLSQIPCDALPEEIQACSPKGTPLPPIMCHWQAGTMRHNEILDRAHTHIETLSEQGCFSSHREKELVKRGISAIFNPLVLAQSMRPIRAGVSLLEECAEERDPDGSPRNYLIALSNWDPASFELFHQRNRDVFNHFDALYISGRTGFIKPRKAAFLNVIESHNLDPEECLFIDDREENLVAAESLGFNTFHLNRGNYQELRQVLLDFGALMMNKR